MANMPISLFREKYYFLFPNFQFVCIDLGILLPPPPPQGDKNIFSMFHSVQSCLQIRS